MHQPSPWTTALLSAAALGLAVGCGLSPGANADEASGDPSSATTGPSTSTTQGTASAPATSTGPSTSSGSETGDSSSTGDAGSSESGTGPGGELWEWDLPEGFPEPAVPADNPMTTGKVELGRHLFYDTRLSENQTQSCATCHEQERAFADALVLPLGSTGQTVPRNSMSLVNVAYSASHTWANPLLENLSDQAAVPLFGEDPIELGAILADEEILERVRMDPTYQELFAEAYPDEAQPVEWLNIRRAIASFERVLISGNSPYDKFRTGDEDAISESARRGFNLFSSELLECHHCHGGFNFSNSVIHADTAFPSMPFFNTGLYNLGENGGYPVGGWGLFEFTADHGDMGKFKPPTLRNIALTAPYMHDGSIATLDEVLDHYAAGGRTIAEGENAGDGSLNPNKSAFVPGFELSEQDRADMLAFFESLTDNEFVSNPAFADPWK